MLHIADLHVSVDGKTILDGLDLDIAPGEVHAIMGRNGSGKTTLSNVLTGRDGYDVTGTVTFDGKDLLELAPEDRAAAGIFLAFQHPVEIPGVGNMYFLRILVEDEEIRGAVFERAAAGGQHSRRHGYDTRPDPRCGGAARARGSRPPFRRRRWTGC